MPRILAFDVGEKRIGVAISDPLSITAQGLETIEKKSVESVLDKIRSLIGQYDAVKIIIGMPYNINGTKGPAAKSIEEFSSLLKKEMAIDVETVDERLTSRQGERVLLEADISRKKRKKFIDKIAAQLILQTYLDLHAQDHRSQ